MVFGTGTSTPGLDKEEGHDVAVFPLAVPSLASPGAILAAVVSTDNREFSIGEQAITACLLLAVLGICLVVLLQANRIYRILGNAGSNLVVRVMGLVLRACIGNRDGRYFTRDNATVMLSRPPLSSAICTSRSQAILVESPVTINCRMV